MKRGKSKVADIPKYITEFTLYITNYTLKALNSRFYAGRCFYNAVLAECEKRRLNMAQLPEYVEAINLLKQAHNTKNIEDKDKENLKHRANQLFKNARNNSGFYLRGSAKYGLTNDIEKYGYNEIRKNWIKDEIDSNSCNELSHRAFEASEKILLRKARRVKFLKKFDFNCLQGKSNSVKLKIVENKLYLYWFGLTVPIIEKNGDPYLEKIKNDLTIVRTVRILKKNVGAKIRFFAQVTCASTPPEKNRYTGKGDIGVDLGTSTISYVTEDGTWGTINLCRRLKNIDGQIRRYQRKLDRQRRQNNPDCFDDQGRFIRGKKLHTFSKRYKVTILKLADLLRKQTEFKKCLQGKTINEFRAKGDRIKREEVEYNKWKERKPDDMGNKRRTFGRSIQKSGVGNFAKRLDYRFSCMNGEKAVVKINTRLTKFSQTCPCCLKQKKKNIKERVHFCEECGFTWGRDLTSSLLALCVEDNGMSLDHAKTLKMIEKLNKEGAF